MNTKPLLTVFTPAYNRAHTIWRTYESLCRQTCKDFEWLIIDDGSTDGTREWLLSLGEKVQETGAAYDWMGRRLEETIPDHFVLNAEGLRIEYVRKPNGGLYTGYNVAYDLIETELCTCIDSDDFAPDDLVENVKTIWEGRDKSKVYCGIVGLDYNVSDKQPIGGAFDNNVTEGYYYEIKHAGDTKEVMCTNFMKYVSPQVGFEGEKDFNPFYMLSQVVDRYPILVDNRNYCWVEYQVGLDSMSQAIYEQYIRSPKSYVKYRINQMKLKHGNSLANRMKLAIHYVSSCIFANDAHWLRNSPDKVLTLCAAPMGLLLNLLIRYKAH